MTDIDEKRGQYAALKAAYRLFGTGDLMKFWLFEEHLCIDKWAHYFPIYEQWFSPYRGKDIVFVEVGVQNGGSAQMWKHYFGKQAHIIGIDIDERCRQFADDFPPTYYTQHLHGLHFYDSIIVAEKKTRPFKPFALPIGETSVAHFLDAL